jgi:threonine synthase
MRYISTRGQSPALEFQDILTSGLAPDGGLYMPESTPHFSLKDIESWRTLPYTELAFKVMAPFVVGAIEEKAFKQIVAESYKGFGDKKVAPVRKLFQNHYLLELYHGPTLAFKDFALQLLGRMLDHVLAKRKQDVVIVGATSGDTGSAAIEGCRHSKHVKIFMLHPHNRTSDIQRRQMTTVLQDNVFNIAVDGTFDDCQNMVKDMFNHPEFAGGKKLVAVNSINWARIMAQIVYYFAAYLQLPEGTKTVAFSVPTGNFGDIFAGYIAREMGLPISQLIVATNANDILHRFFEANDYSMKGVKPTISPSMDIQISSNFERLLFEVHGRDGKAVAKLMQDFKTSGSLKVAPDVLKKVKAVFDSYATNDTDTKTEIMDVHKAIHFVVDPHTATGIRAAKIRQWDKNVPMVTLATAHPAKFPTAFHDTGIDAAPLPPHMKGIMQKEERYHTGADTLGAVKQYIKDRL